MAISSAVRRFLVRSRNEALILERRGSDTAWDPAALAPGGWADARHFLSAGYPRTYTQSSFLAGTWQVLQSVE
jgi:hypothetical protein